MPPFKAAEFKYTVRYDDGAETKSLDPTGNSKAAIADTTRLIREGKRGVTIQVSHNPVWLEAKNAKAATNNAPNPD
jgi:hypothetical protein